MKKQAGHTQARSGYGIILSDSDTDMEGDDTAPIPAPPMIPVPRAAANRSGTGRHRRGRADGTDWESEAAELAEEEASLDVSCHFC